MTPTRFRSLGTQLTAAVLISLAVVAAAVTALHASLVYSQATVAARQRFVEIEASHLRPLADGIWMVDGERIEVLLDAIARLPDVGAVVLVDDAGQRWERRHPRYAQAIYTQRFPLTREADGTTFDLGVLDVDLMADDIRTRALDIAGRITLSTLATLVLSAALVLWVFRRRVSRHLERLGDYAGNLDLQRLDRGPQLDRPARAWRDELDDLVDAFDRMRRRIADDLARREAIERELAAHRDTLELLVDERTAALAMRSAELQLRSDELAEQNRELDAYAHTVAHDLKHPLTSLAGAARLLESAADRLPEGQRTALLQTIQRSAGTMQAIIDALLLLARARRSEPIALHPIDLRATALGAVDRLAGFAAERAATIAVQDAWPSAFGHPQWVEEVWSNYLSNAVKYGGPRPEVALGADIEANGMVHCWVRDRGPGIPESLRDTLFTQFVRLDTRLAEGHGLGLSIVKRIVERQGGAVGHRPRVGGGSEFWFSLPAGPSADHTPLSADGVGP